MARSYLVPINLNQNELQNGRIQNLAAPPGTPVAGQFYYDTGLLASFTYNGTTWVSHDASKLVGTIPNVALTTNPLARANHTGTQLAATISNLTTTVQGYTLNSFAAPTASIPMAGYTFTGIGAPTAAGQAATYDWTLSRPLSSFAAPTANIPMGGFTLTNLAAPTAAGQAATYDFVISQIQSAAAGIASKLPVATVYTANVASLSGLIANDGYTPVAGDRLLLVAQTTASQNGVYTASSGAWTRTTVDGAAPGEIEPGALWLATSGSAYAGTQWRVSTTGAITIGTTNIAIVQFGAASVYTAGNGITLTGSAFSVNPATGGGITVGSGGVSVTPGAVARIVTATIGDGSSLTYTVTHGLNTLNVSITVYQTANPNSDVEVDRSRSGVNAVVIGFSTAPAAGAYAVVVMG